MRGLVIAAAVLGLASPAWAQAGESKPAPKAACAKAGDKAAKPCARPTRKRKNDGTDDAPALRCRDVRSHSFTRCGGPYAEPVPAN